MLSPDPRSLFPAFAEATDDADAAAAAILRIQQRFETEMIKTDALNLYQSELLVVFFKRFNSKLSPSVRPVSGIKAANRPPLMS